MAAEHFESDFQDLAKLFLHNSVIGQLDLKANPVQKETLMKKYWVIVGCLRVAGGSSHVTRVAHWWFFRLFYKVFS